jgi:hypothetical protein
MVSRLQINIIEVFVPLDMIKEIIYLGNRVPIPDWDFI